MLTFAEDEKDYLTQVMAMLTGLALENIGLLITELVLAQQQMPTKIQFILLSKQALDIFPNLVP